MSGRTEVRIEPLVRELLDGVIDPDDASKRMPVDLGIVPWFEDERPLQGFAGLLDWRSNGRLSALVRTGFCVGLPTENVLLPWRRGVPIRRLVLLGFGRLAALTPELARTAAARAVTIANGLRPEHVLFAMPGRLEERDLVEATFHGLSSAISRGAGRRHEPSPPPSRVHLVEGEPEGPEDDDGRPLTVPSVWRPIHAIPERWWVAVDGRHVARVRRLLDGPPRAAES